MEPVTTSPLVFHKPEPLQNAMLQVGDAAAFVDPFIGDGISLALRSGALAAECLSPFFKRKVLTAGSGDDLQSRLSGTIGTRIQGLVYVAGMAALATGCAETDAVADCQFAFHQPPNRENDALTHYQNFAHIVPRKKKLDRGKVAEKIFDVPVIEYPLQGKIRLFGTALSRRRFRI